LILIFKPLLLTGVSAISRLQLIDRRSRDLNVFSAQILSVACGEKNSTSQQLLCLALSSPERIGF
jgi:hypothetical protein